MTLSPLLFVGSWLALACASVPVPASARAPEPAPANASPLPPAPANASAPANTPPPASASALPLAFASTPPPASAGLPSHASASASASAPAPAPASAPAVASVAPVAPPTARARARVGGFVELGWRLMGLGGHVSHGPGFSAGVILFGHLELGLTGFARPGPINPRTFRFDLPPGTTYRGQSSLDLRSDGSMVGLHVAPYYDFRRVPLSLAAPVAVQYGGFGFYLSGADRETPDGRRVSEWENELTGGADADPDNLGVSVGLRLAWRPRGNQHVRPYVGANYLWVPGFRTAVRQRYDGVSGLLGIQFGAFPGPRSPAATGLGGARRRAAPGQRPAE